MGFFDSFFLLLGKEKAKFLVYVSDSADTNRRRKNEKREEGKQEVGKTKEVFLQVKMARLF
jgi:hypothetical protein